MSNTSHSMTARHVLCVPLQERAQAFAARLTFLNKEESHIIKRLLFRMAFHLGYLYGRRLGRTYAYRDLQTLVSRALKACDRAKSLMTRVRS